jgi:hypothetical protein
MLLCAAGPAQSKMNDAIAKYQRVLELTAPPRSAFPPIHKPRPHIGLTAGARDHRSDAERVAHVTHATARVEVT